MRKIVEVTIMVLILLAAFTVPAMAQDSSAQPAPPVNIPEDELIALPLPTSLVTPNLVAPATEEIPTGIELYHLASWVDEWGCWTPGGSLRFRAFGIDSRELYVPLYVYKTVRLSDSREATYQIQLDWVSDPSGEPQAWVNLEVEREVVKLWFASPEVDQVTTQALLWGADQPSTFKARSRLCWLHLPAVRR